jgi:SAM-dependent methyltransferase
LPIDPDRSPEGRPDHSRRPGDPPSAAGCRLCGRRVLPYAPGPPAIVKCSSCGAMSLERIPGKETREALYQESYYSPETGGRFLLPLEVILRWFHWRRYRSIVKLEPGPGAILDVGCGRGSLLEIFREGGWTVMGTQASRTAAEAAKRQRGIDVRCQELPAMELPGKSFRVITLFHVLEHLPDPREYLVKARDLLEDGGLLVVEVPNHGGPGFRLLGVRHFCVDYPNHLFFFTPPSLENLLRSCGFRTVSVSRFSLEYSPFTTLQNVLNLLPGEPSRLYRSLMSNDEGRRLRKSPLTWFHYLLAFPLALPALLLSLTALVLPGGNTMRFSCRKAETPPGGRGS